MTRMKDIILMDVIILMIKQILLGLALLLKSAA